MYFEVCIDSIEGAIHAGRLGAKSVELCTALNSQGGLTPAVGMIKGCVRLGSADVHVMIRPSSGGFVYNRRELRMMAENIRVASQAGA